MLERFVVNNELLDRLESQLSGFNPYTVIGMKYQESRHLRTLAHYLGAKNEHGFGAYFLKRVLKAICASTEHGPSVVDIDVGDFSDAYAQCSWAGIDLLVVCPLAKMVFAIDNKKHSSERKVQISSYRRRLNANPEWAEFQKVCVFLTPEGRPAAQLSHHADWIALSYEEIVLHLAATESAYRGKITAEEQVLLQHYLALLRRHIVEESEIATLARQIYSAHKEALELIFAHRSDRRAKIFSQLKKQIASSDKLQLLSASGAYLRFSYPAWPLSELLQVSHPAFAEAHFMFEICVDDEEGGVITLYLLVADMAPDIREALAGAISGEAGLPSERPPNRFHRVWRYRSLNWDVDETDSEHDDGVRISQWWGEFMGDALPNLAPKVETALTKIQDALLEDHRPVYATA